MGSFSRKLKRKQFVQQRKEFMKHFKESMKNFKMQVKCSSCDRPPAEGENIDQWHINKESENIDLVCPECVSEQLKESANTEEDWPTSRSSKPAKSELV